MVPFAAVEVGFVDDVTVVSESVGSFIQMVSVFRPGETMTLSLTFFMNLMTVDSSAGELGREGGGGGRGREGERGREGGGREKERGEG